ncbi:hypothetical protein DL764_003878 [Monosporascus ibericus]|uniref:Uncharacterized protein n=1 Tax=Monosporascus ibericus TaxID=155417 RepID=A0A4Q4TJA4_9PEZI|nr:hypothetical protein DL764_003878 [Monosporascus ibericus]
MGRQNSSRAAVVQHFCSVGVEGPTTTPAIVLQDFIFQLILSESAKNFTQAACRRYHLFRDRLLEASNPDRFQDLWDYFLSCVVLSKIESLVIILSDLDSLISGADGRTFRIPIEAEPLVDAYDTDDSKLEELTPVKRIVSSNAFDDEDSELDFPVETELDLGLEQDSEDESSNEPEKGLGSQDVLNTQVSSRVPEVSNQGRSPVEIDLVEEEDFDELVSYSDLESEVPSKDPADKENVKHVEDDVAELLWDSDHVED